MKLLILLLKDNLFYFRRKHLKNLQNLKWLNVDDLNVNVNLYKSAAASDLQIGVQAAGTIP